MEKEGDNSKNSLCLSIDPAIHSESNDSFSVSSLDEVQLQYTCRKIYQQKRLSNIEKRVSEKFSPKQRETQNIILYFANLVIPIAISCFNAYTFIDLGVNSELKGVVMISLSIMGFFLSLLSNVLVAPWREVLKLYFLFDSITPVMAAAMIGLYAVLDFLTQGAWYETCYYVAFPIWVAYMTGYLRVLIVYSFWARWQVVCYKLGVLLSGLVFFYIGFKYMNGGYKFTYGFLVAKEIQLKDLTYLYVFGVVELFFEFYRKLSQFDQTDSLKYEYSFSDSSQAENQLITQAHMKTLRHEALQKQLHDLIKSKLNKIEEVSESDSSEEEDRKEEEH